MPRPRPTLGDDADPSLPERALSAFERATGLQVVFHGRRGPLAAALRPERSYHTGSLCLTVKHLRLPACMAFDVELAHRLARQDARVRLKVCHAGIVEWLVGVPAPGGTTVLYAGQRRAADDLRGALVQSTRLPRIGPWSAQVAALPTVGQAEADWIGELFAQLAARLAAWGASAGAMGAAAAAPAAAIAVGEPAEDRAAVIRRFLHQEHAKPLGLAALARQLGLSPTRAGHVVRELFARPFVALRAEARLRTAAGLLRATAMPIPAVAAASGFRDPSRFHRAFRRAYGTTPARYRATGAA